MGLFLHAQFSIGQCAVYRVFGFLLSDGLHNVDGNQRAHDQASAQQSTPACIALLVRQLMKRVLPLDR